jgi:hypothetical protein
MNPSWVGLMKAFIYELRIYLHICIWGLHSSGIWHSVTGWSVPSVLRQGNGHPTLADWDLYAVSKQWAPVIQWCGAVSKKWIPHLLCCKILKACKYLTSCAGTVFGSQNIWVLLLPWWKILSEMSNIVRSITVHVCQGVT